MDITASSARLARAKGFSLLELLTVLTICLLLVIVGIPNMREFVARNLQQSEINTFITHFHLARSEAVKRATRTVLCPTDDSEICDGSNNWHSGFIIFVDDNANRHRDEDEALVRIYQDSFESQISINSTHGRRRLTYQADGSSPGSNVTITFCNVDSIIDPKAIILSNTGRPRLSDTRPDGSPLNCG